MPKLWQTLEKKDIDVFDELTLEEWEDFVKQNEHTFSEHCSEIGQNLFNKFQCERDYE
tara:strand:+ start:363 stop:536 length:174 start_codon:yes stop_codon:yes gene_type:complete